MSKKQMLALLKQMLYAYFYMPKKSLLLKFNTCLYYSLSTRLKIGSCIQLQGFFVSEYYTFENQVNKPEANLFQYYKAFIVMDASRFRHEKSPI